MKLNGHDTYNWKTDASSIVNESVGNSLERLKKETWEALKKYGFHYPEELIYTKIEPFRTILQKQISHGRETALQYIERDISNIQDSFDGNRLCWI